MTGRSPNRSLLALFERDFGDPDLAKRLDLEDALSPSHVRAALLDPAAAFLSRPGKAFRARLVEIGWSASGAADPVPIELPLAVELIHAGSLIVDDIQDGSTHRRRRPALHREVGLPLALNVANWLYFWPFELVGDLGLPAHVELDVRRRMTRALYRSHFGQALDLHSCVSHLSRDEIPPLARSIGDLKTGRLMELAAALGLAAADAPRERVEAFARFGRALGAALQMLDDLGNLAGARDAAKRHEDLRLGRVTWPWAWLAADLEPEEFAVLQERAERVRLGEEEPEALAAAMRALLSGEEKARAGAHLRDALDALRREVGPEIKLTPLCDEIARLEESYV